MGLFIFRCWLLYVVCWWFGVGFIVGVVALGWYCGSWWFGGGCWYDCDVIARFVWLLVWFACCYWLVCICLI